MATLNGILVQGRHRRLQTGAKTVARAMQDRARRNACCEPRDDLQTVFLSNMAAAGMRDWVRPSLKRPNGRWRRTGERGVAPTARRSFFTLRARHVKQLFTEVEALANAVDKRSSRSQAHQVQRALNPKNLGGIEVPDGARSALEFLERRVEVVVQPLASIGGRPAPLGPLATARSSSTTAPILGRRLVRLSLREDGGWLRKAARRQRSRSRSSPRRTCAPDRVARLAEPEAGISRPFASMELSADRLEGGPGEARPDRSSSRARSNSAMARLSMPFAQ